MKTLTLTFIFLSALVACTKTSIPDTPSPVIPENPEKKGIYFDQEAYTISAIGGEIHTSVANMDFEIGTAEIFPLILENDRVFYTADLEGNKLSTDFYTAEKTDDLRIVFWVNQNTTGKEKKHIIVLQHGNTFGSVFLIQTAN